tara:strand:- start:222 stop:1091 length:870 start_codon:yes stop_codon:yes gene_type:complete
MIPSRRYYNLIENDIIKISGSDKCKFLQGIISNDIDVVENGKPIYSSMLSPQGRFLCDFFVFKKKQYFLLECNKIYSQEILKKLNMYKLRCNVTFEIENNLKILLLNTNDIDQIVQNIKKVIHFSDPRFKNFFSRMYVDNTDLIKIIDHSKLNKMTSQSYRDYRLKSYVPDFLEDAESGKSLLMEMRFDQLNGISWDKGCYMGQEVTARMKYRNIVKRKIFGVKINYQSFTNSQIEVDGESIGTLTSNTKEYGISVINLKQLDSFVGKKIYSGDSTLTVEIPWWAKTTK